MLKKFFIFIFFLLSITALFYLKSDVRDMASKYKQAEEEFKIYLQEQKKNQEEEDQEDKDQEEETKEKDSKFINIFNGDSEFTIGTFSFLVFLSVISAITIYFF